MKKWQNLNLSFLVPKQPQSLSWKGKLPLSEHISDTWTEISKSVQEAFYKLLVVVLIELVVVVIITYKVLLNEEV